MAAAIAFDEQRQISSMNATGSSQNEMLFMRGNAMSGAPIISGTNQLPKPPIIAGMTMKNTMIRPCAGHEHVEQVRIVRKVLQTWSCSSRRMATDSAPPTTPAIMAKIRYIVPMSLWFVEYSQRLTKLVGAPFASYPAEPFP